LRQEVSAEVRKLCADLMRNADEMRLHERQRSLLKEALAVALAQYTTGKVPQADVLRAQMALTRLSEHLIELEEERDNARAQLNALMGRPSGRSNRNCRQLRSSRDSACNRGTGAHGHRAPS
jgi:cobalt-zinc-cadmium efflux system outer membrane protein